MVSKSAKSKTKSWGQNKKSEIQSYNNKSLKSELDILHRM